MNVRRLLFAAAALAAIVLPGSAAAYPPLSTAIYPTLLLNRSHPLKPLTYAPQLASPAVPLADNSEDLETFLAVPAAPALTALFKGARSDGINLLLSSGYRSYYDQLQLYQASLLTDSVGVTEVVAQPGYSEHQTGLAADVIQSDYFCAAEGCFALTRAAAWLHDNAYRYGFIVRYPPYGHNSTGYEYEPWHLRYVGVSLAATLTAKQETLEEYYGYP
jgi:D-alanyl-D-alanine carboxypeptidase